MTVSIDDITNKQQLLHYQLGQSLGEGGFGQVFQAWDSKLHRKVAIKYLKNAINGVDLLKEARLAASLHHSAFVKIHAMEQVGRTQAIVMELVPGRTLRQMREDDSANPAPNHLPNLAKVLDIVQQVAQAMHEAHTAGLVHGDLKPSNLMQEPSGAVRILDFGLASQSDRDATTSLVQADPLGTIAYMAPELLTGATIRPSSDIYALGVILYELLTGSRPFSNLSGLGLAAALIQSNSDQWPWPDTLPFSLRQLVRAMTARQLDQRFSTMEMVATQCAQLAAVDSSLLHSVSINLGALNLASLPVSSTHGKFINWRSLRKPSPRGLMVVFVVLILFGVWNSQPYWQQAASHLAPYSESQEMKRGLQALEYTDRHEMLDSAEQHFGKILKHTPEHAAAAASISLVYSYRSSDEVEDNFWLLQAEKQAQRALKLNEFLSLSHIAYAKTLSLRDQHALALVALERALALDPNSHWAWRIKIEVLMQVGRLMEAQALAKQGLERFPQERVFAEQMGQINDLQNAYKESEVAYGMSIKLKPDGVAGYLGLSNALLKQKLADEAVQTLQAGLKVRSSAELYDALGRALFSQGDYVGAASAYENAVAAEKGNPDNYLGWVTLGDTLAWIPGRTDSVRKAYEKAQALLIREIAQSPDNAELLSRLGLCTAKLGDGAEAVISLEQALKLAPNNPVIQFRAGLSYEIIGQRAPALAAIAKAKQLSYPIKIIEAEPGLVALRRDPIYLQK